MEQEIEKRVLVYADWNLFDSPQLIGNLYFSSVRGNDTYAFEYNEEWIKNVAFSIDPELPCYAGANKGNFGIFKDSSPDRWGQLLMKRLGSSYHTYLSQRFDRTATNKRIHYASAMTLLGHTDGDDAGEGVSYLDIADFIKSSVSDFRKDLEELFRRIIFSVCVSNTDDHFRNHGFIYTKNGWSLSPAFDLNANEMGTGLKLKIK